MNRPLLALFFAAAAVTAQEPALKLVPRPIPGMPAAPQVENPTDILMSGLMPPPARRSSSPSSPAPVSQPPVVAVIANEPARILFVHRRDRLPAAMRQRLKALPVEPATAPVRPTAAHEMIEERPSTIRIIPKSEVPLIKPPSPSPTPP